MLAKEEADSTDLHQKLHSLGALVVNDYLLAEGVVVNNVAKPGSRASWLMRLSGGLIVSQAASADIHKDVQRPYICTVGSSWGNRAILPGSQPPMTSIGPSRETRVCDGSLSDDGKCFLKRWELNSVQSRGGVGAGPVSRKILHFVGVLFERFLPRKPGFWCCSLCLPNEQF